MLMLMRVLMLMLILMLCYADDDFVVDIYFRTAFLGILDVIQKNMS